MAFEKFTQKGKSFRPVVAIWSRGQIGFNQGALNICKIENDDYVIFFYDPEEKKVGFKFTKNSKEDGAFKFKMYKTGAFASAKTFLDYYQIDYKTTTKYELSRDNENDMFVIDLKRGLNQKEDET